MEEHVRPARSTGGQIASIVYVIGSAITALLLIRFVLLLLGANPATAFVEFVYSLSEPLVYPFHGILGNFRPQAGAVVQSVFDTASLVAALVYSVLSGIIGRLAHSVGRV